jgi:TetR/AcrR family transcriptional regulator, regulator of autoinduction and epiphytic fitness
MSKVKHDSPRPVPSPVPGGPQGTTTVGTEPVQGVRAQKAEATRRRVVEQARTLFLAQGYAATTTREVAAAAQVTERTLFNLVATKSDLLREVLLTYVFTDDYGPLLERKDFQPVIRAGTPDQLLSAFTRWVLALHQQTSAVAEMTRAAGVVDPGAAEIWRWGNAQQVTDLLNFSVELRSRGWLRPGDSPRAVARSLAVLCGHETYWRMVVQEEASPAQYRRWLRRHCAAELAD